MEGVQSAQIFFDELAKARALAKLGDMTPEELLKAKQAWQDALALTKSAEHPIEITSDAGRVIGRYSNGSQLEVISRSEKLYGGNTIKLTPDETTTVSGTLDDVNVVARRGERLPGVTQMGENQGGINILRSPKWGEIQAKYKPLLDEGKELEYWKKVTDEFWETVNKPWLDEAMARRRQLSLRVGSERREGYLRHRRDHR